MASKGTTRTPGAYIEQVFRRQEPVFSTGVPAFIGLVAASDPSGRAAEAEAKLFASDPVARIDKRTFSELETRAGAAWGGDRLGLAVRGFFENGGSLCYAVDPRLGGLNAGLDALYGVDDFDLVCAPDLVPSIVTELTDPKKAQTLVRLQSELAPVVASELMARQVKLVDFCNRRGGCFAILDSIGEPIPTLAVTEATLKSQREQLEALLGAILGGANAALYGPWIKVRGGCATCKGSGVAKDGSKCVPCGGAGAGFLPPCGHVAGMYARTDANHGVHKAPANEVIEGAVDIQYEISDSLQAYINPKGASWLNCVRAFPGRGIRIWGARTLTPTTEWHQVSVRRLILTIGRWLELTAQKFAFEPNNFALWVRITRQVTAYLQGLFAKGALKGRSPKEAFYVKCDAETNPPAAREAGQVVTEVGVAPVLPNEFITVRLISGAESISTFVST
jgi:hypothetical protein